MGKIRVRQIKCPVCGAALKLKDEGYGQTTCEYCRAIVYVDREDTKVNGEITIYSNDNKAIATLNIPIGWNIANTFVNYNKSSMRIPYCVGVDLENDLGSIIHIETGSSFEMFGAASYLGQTQAMHTIQKDFITVDKYLDEYINEFAMASKKKVEFVEDIDIPIKGYNKEKDFKEYQQVAMQEAEMEQASSGVRPSISALYCDSACRLYQFDDKAVVAYTKEYGYMFSLGGFGAIGNSIGSLVEGIGGFAKKAANNVKNSDGSILNKMADSGLLGGMLGKKYKTQNKVEDNKKDEVKEEVKEEVKVKDEKIDENSVYYGKIRKPGIGELYMWMSDPVFILIAPKDDYKKITEKAFKQVCSSFKLSPEVISEFNSLRMQWEQENRMMMNNQAQAQRQHGDALIRMGQQRMEANHSYINSMMERSNKQYQTQRDSYNSRMAAQDRMRDARSEAIRGVNTYIKPDGKEVEVPVSADTAWINGKGEIVGGTVGFNPGAGWTKLERK